MTDGGLTMMLFAHEPQAIRMAMDTGIRDFMVDCERKGKSERQNGADTDISQVDMENISGSLAVAGAMVNCRINGFGDWTEREIDAALAKGFHRIFLPMVRNMSEAERFVRLVNGRARAAILIETDEAVRIASDLASLPLDAVYVGLNDLAISRGYRAIFEALLDGTVEHIREQFEQTAFGFGGVTLLGCGHPCPSELLLAEMQRLNCHFSFLRRSYYRDVAGKDAAQEIVRLQEFWRQLSKRNDDLRTFQKQQLDRLIKELVGRA